MSISLYYLATIINYVIYRLLLYCSNYAVLRSLVDLVGHVWGHMIIEMSIEMSFEG